MKLQDLKAAIQKTDRELEKVTAELSAVEAEAASATERAAAGYGTSSWNDHLKAIAITDARRRALAAVVDRLRAERAALEEQAAAGVRAHLEAEIERLRGEMRKTIDDARKILHKLNEVLEQDPPFRATESLLANPKTEIPHVEIDEWGFDRGPGRLKPVTNRITRARQKIGELRAELGALKDQERRREILQKYLEVQ
ncbi:MAG TPA: hypothetical protein VNJ11_01055 [Bryobacteraceae bacterium]|nr:hypothetical protein [Bryobacteraceae bacterium]